MNELLQEQVTAFSKIKFVYQDLIDNPPTVAELIDIEQFLKYDALTESKKMLIVNYLYALLAHTKNNKISVHNNPYLNQTLISEFMQTHGDIVEKIKIVRDKVYAHIDLNWMSVAKNISNDEIQCCIDFLNNIFGENK
ncbi:MAG: hypothetical protein K2M47_02930 [Clostridiales bacterium]|nr:hypothetical protein [Clostridiales bacterium]